MVCSASGVERGDDLVAEAGDAVEGFARRRERAHAAPGRRSRRGNDRRRPSVSMLPPTVRVVTPSRPAAARISLISASAAGRSCSSVWFIGSQPSPTSAARRLAALPSPPMSRLGLRLLHRLRVEHHRRRSRRTHRGARRRRRSTSRRQMSMHSSTRRPRVAKSRPIASHSSSSQLAPMPNSTRPPRQHVEGRDRTRGDERVAQTDVVDVWCRDGPSTWSPRSRPAPSARRTPACSAGSVGGVSPSCGTARHLHREHEVLRQPHRLEAGLLGGLRRPRSRTSC